MPKARQLLHKSGCVHVDLREYEHFTALKQIWVVFCQNRLPAKLCVLKKRVTTVATTKWQQCIDQRQVKFVVEDVDDCWCVSNL